MKAILFDFGGTLDTNGVHWSEKFWEYYQRFRLNVRKERFESAFITSEKELGEDPSLRQATFFATLLRQFNLQLAILGVKLPSGDIVKLVNACYADVGREIANAKKVLRQYQGNYKMGVVSNFYGNLDVVCEEFGLIHMLEVRIDSAVVGIKKPDPEIFRLAINRMGVVPGETFVVGDSYDRDIVPAHSLGCTTVWLHGKSWTEPSSTDAASFTIQKFEELSTVIPHHPADQAGG